MFFSLPVFKHQLADEWDFTYRKVLLVSKPVVELFFLKVPPTVHLSERFLPSE